MQYSKWYFRRRSRCTIVVATLPTSNNVRPTRVKVINRSGSASSIRLRHISTRRGPQYLQLYLSQTIGITRPVASCTMQCLTAQLSVQHTIWSSNVGNAVAATGSFRSWLLFNSPCYTGLLCDFAYIHQVKSGHLAPSSLRPLLSGLAPPATASLTRGDTGRQTCSVLLLAAVALLILLQRLVERYPEGLRISQHHSNSLV